MKTKIGIVGYGNLGKAVEKEILKNKDLHLFAIFSRRCVKSNFNTTVINYENITEYKNKIDIMIMCSGSANDIETQLLHVSKYFCTIDAFDTHAKLFDIKNKLSLINKENKTISISASGWDPGILSLIRCLFFSLSCEKIYTFWGKGISMGHSDALRQIKGVVDAVQFTIPKREAINKAIHGTNLETNQMHIRECFVNADEQNYDYITKNINEMPNYFRGYKTNIHFVSREEILKLKEKTSHKGQVFARLKLSENYINKKYKEKFAEMKFSLKTDSNAEITAKILVLYVNAINKIKLEKKYDCYFPIDIPLSYLLSRKQYEKYIKNYC